jgi:hypothetical protein
VLAEVFRVFSQSLHVNSWTVHSGPEMSKSETKLFYMINGFHINT